MEIFKSMGGNIPGGIFLGGNFSGGSFPDTLSDIFTTIEFSKCIFFDQPVVFKICVILAPFSFAFEELELLISVFMENISVNTWFL